MTRSLHRTRWWFKFPDTFHALGPTIGRYLSERDARREAARALGRKLPVGTEFWRADPIVGRV